MAKLITVEEALSRKLIENGDWVNPSECLSKDDKKIIIPTQESGCDEKQKFSIERNLKFFFAFDKYGIPTLWGDTTQQELILEGYRGYSYSESILKNIMQLYTNCNTGVFARPWTEKDVELMNTDWILKNRIGSYSSYIRPAWLCSSYVRANANHIRFGVRYVSSSGIVSGSSLYDSLGNAYTYSYGFHPAISILESKVLVDEVSMKETGAWKLVPIP